MRRAALIALSLPLAACGSSSSSNSNSAVGAVTAAAQKTYAAGSESLALRATVDALGRSLPLEGSGGFDTKSARGSMTFTVHEGSISTKVVEVVERNDVYVKSALLDRIDRIPAGKPWVKIDLAKAHLTGIDLQALLAEDPRLEMTDLQSLKSAQKIGTARIDGISAVHYSAETTRRGFPRYDVWVGGDGYIHRLRVTQAAPKASVVVDLSHFGRAVNVSVPAAAQVYEAKSGSIPELKGSGG